KARRGKTARRGERELVLVRALSGKNARGALAARVRLHDEKRAHDGRSLAGAGAEIHAKSRGGERGQKLMRGVLHSRLRRDPRMDLATKEHSSCSAISEPHKHLRARGFTITAARCS